MERTLVALLGREDPGLRRKAAEVLGDIGTAAAARALIRAMASVDELTRAHAAWSLGKIGWPGAGSRLVSALDDSSPMVRANALISLLRLRTRGWDDRLDRLLEDRNSAVRANAALACGVLGLKRMAARLTALLADPVPYVRRNALRGLFELGGSALKTGLSKVGVDGEADGLTGLSKAILAGELVKWRKVSRSSFVRVVLHDLARNPVPGERVLLIAVSGEIRAMASDENGEVREERIEPGPCALEFAEGSYSGSIDGRPAARPWRRTKRRP
jgi:HEAT repeat protein